ncbi:ImmA/IrrE family metallo-endopeptidase [Bifidobacterium sp. ESL0784]|uniref:ImmA/IrrE family metallo-endopeptidase n=1 Tax=Bifidobacterium sp. ESL0784 TaxID=2983231 RepID=UPI0023F6A5F8|nr:ImmA/IrrE family metallo-endopeptidase [Bifidobacterium sp. ESL0784]MDF7641755.1 ImmA/IrrE family metallo-endopeptidase [Bifidobacterium sp. ESL0784]
MTDIEAFARRRARVLVLPMGKGFKGAYDFERDTIYLSDKLTDVQHRCVLAHELSHAIHGDKGCRNSHDVVELRADVEAAKMLIDQADYMQAEQCCDNPTWIARELGVTVDLVRAYRYWLHESMPRICYDDLVS